MRSDRALAHKILSEISLKQNSSFEQNLRNGYSLTCIPKLYPYIHRTLTPISRMILHVKPDNFFSYWLPIIKNARPLLYTELCFVLAEQALTKADIKGEIKWLIEAAVVFSKVMFDVQQESLRSSQQRLSKEWYRTIRSALGKIFKMNDGEAHRQLNLLNPNQRNSIFNEQLDFVQANHNRDLELKATLLRIRKDQATLSMHEQPHTRHFFTPEAGITPPEQHMQMQMQSQLHANRFFYNPYSSAIFVPAQEKDIGSASHPRQPAFK